MKVQKFKLNTINKEYHFYQVESYLLESEDKNLLKNITYCQSTFSIMDKKTGNSKEINKINFIYNLRKIRCDELNYNKSEYKKTDVEYVNVSKVLDDYQQKNLIKFTKCIFWHKKNKIICFYCSKYAIIMENLNEPDSNKILLNIEGLGTIIDIFPFEIRIVDDKKDSIDYKIILKVIVNNNLLIELNVNSNDDNFSTKIIGDYLKSEKIDNSKFIVISYQSNKFSIPVLPYRVISSVKKNTLMTNVIIFDNSITINSCAFRPNCYNSNDNFCLSFKDDFGALFHNETNALLAVYKTSGWNITSMTFSFDGCILALGCQDDNIYIIDVNNSTLLLCLQGHENYITSLCFSDIVEESYANENNYDDLNILYSTSKLSNHSKNSVKNNFDDQKKFELSKFLSIYDIHENQDLSVLLKRKITENVSNSKFSSENIIIKGYTLFSTSLDGNIATWQIEYRYTYNSKIGLDYKIDNEKKIILLDSLKVVSLDSSIENVVKPINLAYVSNSQIYDLKVYDNVLIYCAKNDYNFNNLYLKLFFAKDESIEEDNTLMKNLISYHPSPSKAKSFNLSSVMNTSVKSIGNKSTNKK